MTVIDVGSGSGILGITAAKLGAKKVVVDWSYQPLQKTHVRYRSLRTLSERVILQKLTYYLQTPHSCKMSMLLITQKTQPIRTH